MNTCDLTTIPVNQLQIIEHTCFKTKECLVYRVRFKVSGNKFVSKTLATKDLNTAISECTALFNSKNKPLFKESSEQTTITLAEAMKDYLEYLNNINVPIYEVKVRSSGHIKDVERHFRYVDQALKEEGINYKFLNFEAMISSHVSIIYRYVKDVMGHKNKTINKLISTLRIFSNYIIRKYRLSYNNPFSDVVKLPVKANIEVIDKKEFFDLMSVIKFNNGWITLNSGERKNLYKSWLINYFKLALYTGRRREELIMLKFSDIVTDEYENLLFLKSEHYKVNRLKSATTEEAKDFVLIPITQELRELIFDLGYETNKGLSKYLIADNDPMQRRYMMELATKAFTHYYSLLNSTRSLKFKCLRKTYITQLYIKYGDSSKFITHHSDVDVIKKHYLDQKQLANSIKEFRVFD